MFSVLDDLSVGEQNSGMDLLAANQAPSRITGYTLLLQ